jgi:hypothetical protein
VLEELVARVVDLGGRGVVFQDALARELAREVLARVEVFEEAAGGVEVLGEEFDLARLRGRMSISDARVEGQWGLSLRFHRRRTRRTRP